MRGKRAKALRRLANRWRTEGGMEFVSSKELTRAFKQQWKRDRRMPEEPDGDHHERNAEPEHDESRVWTPPDHHLYGPDGRPLEPSGG